MSTPQQSKTSNVSALTPQFKELSSQNIKEDDDYSDRNPDGWLAISQPSQSQECQQYDCFAEYYLPKQSNAPLQCKQSSSITMRSEQITPCNSQQAMMNSRSSSTIMTVSEISASEISRRIQQILKMEIQGWSLRLAGNAEILKQMKTNSQRSNEQIARKLHLEHNFQ